jgi:hypothetical protein
MALSAMLYSGWCGCWLDTDKNVRVDQHTRLEPVRINAIAAYGFVSEQGRGAVMAFRSGTELPSPFFGICFLQMSNRGHSICRRFVAGFGSCGDGQGVHQNIFDAPECATFHALLKEAFEFRLMDFDGHGGVASLYLFQDKAFRWFCHEFQGVPGVAGRALGALVQRVQWGSIGFNWVQLGQSAALYCLV